MPSNPTKFPVSLEFGELSRILDALKKQRANRYEAERKDFTAYKSEDGRIEGYAVSGAEDALVERAALAELIYKLSGEVITEDPDNVLRVAQARRDYDAQCAADKAEADAENADA